MLDRCSYHPNQSIVAAAAAPTMSASTNFSLFFPVPKVQWPAEAAADEAACDDHSSITTSPSSPSSSSAGSVVDCTLSLGTPSSRRTAEPAKHVAPPAHPSAPSWEVAADQPSYYCHQGGKPAGGAARGAAQGAFADRRCANCGTTSTPLWRNGPRGPKSLCNACGIRFKKEERRAAATAAMESGGGGAGCGYSAQRAQYEYGAAAAAASAAAAKASPGAVSYSEGAFPCGGDADANAPFLAWRLNVVAPAFAAVWPERTSLFQYNC